MVRGEGSELTLSRFWKMASLCGPFVTTVLGTDALGTKRPASSLEIAGRGCRGKVPFRSLLLDPCSFGDHSKVISAPFVVTKPPTEPASR